MTGATFEFCERCGTETATMHLTLSSGLIGRVCSECRTCRKGRPYARKDELKAKARKGRRRGRNASR